MHEANTHSSDHFPHDIAQSNEVFLEDDVGIW